MSDDKPNKVVPMDAIKAAMWGKTVTTPRNDGPFRPDAEARLRRGDLRNMQHATCRTCGYDWWAPIVGRCPRCSGAGPHEIDERKEIGVPRA